ncbi:MAG: Energy-coupling factor transporter transmembrane protein EcfT [Firmicutes bacterium ADurb.Bin300]|jgi:energy-coupling factor transport system permease protein|nr:MAG: Energy-coupling factor transporter transmembrane protein EcfT [Firmicutes bacterium ADurb.Bin300]
MIKDITIGQFFPGKSFIHKLDARIKIVLTGIILVMIFVCGNFYSLGLMSAFILFSFLLTRLSLRLILKSFKPLVLILVITSLLQLYYVDKGEILFSWRKLSITSGGVYMMIFITVRILSLILVSSLLTYTTSPTSLTYAIESLLSPLKVFKVEVHTFAMMMTIALRFIPTLIEEIDRIMNAQKARGADFETGSLVSRIKALFPIFIPLFVSSFKRAFELADAMSCRCYTGGKGRTRMKQQKTGVRDLCAAAAVIVLSAAVIWLNAFFGRVV